MLGYVHHGLEHFQSVFSRQRSELFFSAMVFRFSGHTGDDWCDVDVSVLAGRRARLL